MFHSWALAICDEDALQVDRWQGFEDARATNLSGQAATWLVQGYECWCVVLVQVGRGITPLGGSTCHSEPLTRSSRRSGRGAKGKRPPRDNPQRNRGPSARVMKPVWHARGGATFM